MICTTAPARDDPREQRRIVGEAPIALRMRDDRRDVEKRELVEHRIRRRRQRAGQELDEQIAPAIQRREGAAPRRARGARRRPRRTRIRSPARTAGEPPSRVFSFRTS